MGFAARGMTPAQVAASLAGQSVSVGSLTTTNATTAITMNGGGSRLTFDTGQYVNSAANGALVSTGGFGIGIRLWTSASAPTISSGFGTSPSIVTANGTAAFTLNVGTGGTANSGVITLPAATTGWALSIRNLSSNNATQFVTKQTATTTTTATIGNYDAAGVAAAWAASDVLLITAYAY